MSGEVEGGFDGGGCIGINFLDEVRMFHNPMLFRDPVIITLLFLIILILYLLRIAIQLSSHS